MVVGSVAGYTISSSILWSLVDFSKSPKGYLVAIRNPSCRSFPRRCGFLLYAAICDDFGPIFRKKHRLSGGCSALMSSTSTA